jgi:hypothetical protein
MTRWVLVELEEELPAYRQVGLFCAFQQLPGVVSVTDLAAISQDTLESYLLGAAETVRVPVRIRQLDLMT